jgi:predicted DNA-binding protein
VKSLSQKIGRPKSKNPKDVRFSIRIDNETNQKLEHYCDENNLTKGEAIRNGIDLLLENKIKK